jgi:hypothetical protein
MLEVFPMPFSLLFSVGPFALCGLGRAVLFGELL